MTDNFYRAFEEKFRGSRGMIKSRLQVYLPFVKPLLVFLPSAQATDLGCGRGEWLELLAEIGFDAQGVDIDDAMLSACRERGLKVQTGDALAFLRGLPDASQSVVSGFHIAEHLPFETLKELVKEALRVLLPGGLLILETPNPENLVVGTSTFYLDPTHHRPIPPQLLAFLPEYFGFKHIKILRLQESPELAKATEVTFLSVLSGVSPDYAVIAQKEGPDEIFAALQSAFDTEYGLNLETLAHRYQQQAEARATAAEQRTAAAEARATAAEQHAAAAEARVNDLLNSTSWRITAPLRWLAGLAHRFTPQALKPKLKLFLQHTALYVRRRPWLRRVTLGVLAHFPSLKTRLLRIVTDNGASHSSRQSDAPTELAHLTPRARRIYTDLKSALARQQKEGN